MNWKDAKWFVQKEFQCQCGKCGLPEMSFTLIDALDWLRETMGVPFTVTSGYRCPAHNKAVGGAPKSFHLFGKAADITVTRKILLPLIYKIGIVSKRFNGMGLSENKLIHFDVGDRPTPYYFVYPPSSRYKQLNPDILKEIQSKTIEEHLREFKV